MYPSGSGQTNGTNYQAPAQAPASSGGFWSSLLSKTPNLSPFFSGLGDLYGAKMLSSVQFPNPATGAMPYLNQIPAILQKYFSPYGAAGTQAMGTLQNQYSQLLSNPGAIFNQIGSGFQQSPGYNFQVQQMQNSANNAAAAGGTLGSPAEQQTIAGNVGQMANSDFYNYMNHALSMYGMGLHGEEGINNMGFMANSELAKNIMSALMSQAGLSYSGQADWNQMEEGQLGAAAGLTAGGIGGIGTGIASMFGL
jgi:hypothetical protein